MYYRPELNSVYFGNAIGVPNERFRLPPVIRNAPVTIRTAGVRRALIPVNLMDGAARAIAYFANSKTRAPSAEVHLLNVQRLSMKGDFALDAAPDIECRAKRAIGMEVLTHARAPLDAQGIACKTSVLFGDPADTIANYAREHRIDTVVMETTHLHWLKRLLYSGSVSAKVARMVDAEVTLVGRSEDRMHFMHMPSNNGIPHTPRAVN